MGMAEASIWKNPYQRMGFINVNVLIGDVLDSDRDLFFGPLRGDEVFVTEEPTTTLPALLAKLGIFETGNEAAQRGYRGRIPEGFTDLMRIRKLHRVSVLKIAREGAGE